MGYITREERALEKEKGWDIGFIHGLSENEIVVDEADLIDLVTYEKADGTQLYVDTALGGGIGGYYVFSRSATGNRKRFKRIDSSESLRLAQGKLNSYAKEKEFKLVGRMVHPNCTSRKEIRGDRMKTAYEELREQLGYMSFELFCECFPDGVMWQEHGVLEWTDNPQLNFYLNIFTRSVLSDRFVSNEMVLSILKRPEKIRESESWGNSAGKPVGLTQVVEYLAWFDEVHYQAHQPNLERDNKFRMGKSNWECMSKKKREHGQHIHELHNRVQKLWALCQGVNEPTKKNYVQLMLPGMNMAA